MVIEMKPYNWVKPSKSPLDPEGAGTWRSRHRNAFRMPYGHAAAVRDMLKAWCLYAENHKRQHGAEIGADYVLGPAWRDMGLAVRTMLNGELGGLDAGTLDTIIVDNLTAQGFGDEL